MVHHLGCVITEQSVHDKVEQLVDFKVISQHLLIAIRHQELVGECIEHLWVLPKEAEELVDRVRGILRFKLFRWVFDQHAFLWKWHPGCILLICLYKGRPSE